MPRSRKQPIVGVGPIGDVPRIFTSVIAGHLSGYLDVEPRALPPTVLPLEAYSAERNQYEAARMLQCIEAAAPPEVDKMVCVTSVDLFVPIFSHVFGEARLSGRSAVVSTHRMAAARDGCLPAPERVYERTAKVALHEAGHLFSLMHCRDPRCLMHFSGDVDQLDRADFLFCRYCRSQLLYAFGSLRGEPPAAGR